MQEIRLEFHGRLTLANARQALADQQRALGLAAKGNNASQSCKVIADLSGLADVDTAALAVILQLDRDARSQIGRPLMIQGASQDLRSLARLSSLDSVLNWE
jgi:ABC-type transporter Mla MlaB component